MKWLLYLFRESIGFFLIRLGFLFTNNENNILSIYFHNPSKRLFERIAHWLLKNNYQFISVKELEQCISKKAAGNKFVVITFDDAWANNLDLIESFEQLKIPVTIFIPTEPVKEGNYWWEYANQKGQSKFSKIAGKKDFKSLPEKIFNEKVGLLKKNYSLQRSCMTLEQIKQISENKWITIGSHTVSHPILKNCSFRSQQFELFESKKILNEWTKKPIDYLAFPNGDFNNETLQLAKKAGYKLAFSIEPARINVRKVDPFKVPRYAINDNGGYFENIAKVMGIWQKIFS
jgi:peptidoglycan/xylan/chitin deacetylase (PgdA/CDA1 family)